jgi:hypothetical protein
MRILFDIAIVTVLVATVWSSIPTGAKQQGTVSIDPASLVTTTTNLPTEQYDAF